MDPTTARRLGRSRRLLLLVPIVILAACATASAPAPVAPGGAGTAQDLADKAAAERLQAFGASGAPTAGPAGGGAPTALKDTTRIVWTGSLQLQVSDLDAALNGAQGAITGLGGYISASRRTGTDQPVASVTYRIPSDRWEDGLAALRKLAIKVIDEQTNSADVASQLIDNDARLKNLRASETALQDIASKATKISDVLEVETKLTEVRGQIESLAAQQVALQDQVSYGTLTATYGLQVVAVTQAAKQWDPAREVDAASARLVSFLQAMATAAIWFAIVGLPALLVLAVIVFIVIRLARRLGLTTSNLGPGAPRGGPGGAGPIEG
jgi:hypothetical protein